jgi:gluconolactonase
MTGTGRDYGPNALPLRYPDPDVVVLDPRFANYRVGNTPIKRLWTGALWMEGPAWCAAGRYLVWSDIPNNRQLRWLDEDGHVSVFRGPSGNSNGNTFDAQGRQISCEHLNRRVVRYELDGSTTVLADTWDGRPLNSPNDVAVHADGGVWFTDPPYGTLAAGGYEGTPGGEVYHDSFVYRVDGRTGAVTRVLPEGEMDRPNGLCFSPDFSRLYIVDTGTPKNIRVYDVVDGSRLANGRQFSNLSIMVDGQEMNAGSDGIRVDVDGNVWSAAAGGPGIDGVQVFTPEGERIGQILLPERCANLCFGGAKRNRLFMAASQSLYAVYVNTRGAHWG